MDTGSLVRITPKTKLLKPDEIRDLLEFRRRSKREKPLPVGNKKLEVTNTPEDAKELENLYNKLYERLTLRRVGRTGKRIGATWIPARQAALVHRKVGKLDNFGYNIKSDYYLEYMETLFLLEKGRLILDYQSKLLSIEQAYVLILGEKESIKYNEYIVYTNLIRAGFIIRKHKNDSSRDTLSKSSETECVWEILLHELQKKSIRESIKNSKCYSKIHNEFKAIKNHIIMQEDVATTSGPDEVWQFNTLCKRPIKRKHPASHSKPAKKKFFGNSQSLLDVLKNDPEYQEFKSLFESFEVVKLRSSNDDLSNETSLEINFDLYLHNDGFKRSAPKKPVYGIIVLPKAARFPSHDEIATCHRKQTPAVPLLVVSVSDSKQLHAFLYYIS